MQDKKRQKILLVANTSWSLYKFRLGIIERLISHEFEVHLVSPKDDFVDELKLTGAQFHSLKHLHAKNKNPISDFLLFNELKAIYKRIGPSIIFHYTIKPNIYGTLAAKKLGIPSIAIITGLGYTFLKKGMTALLAKLLYMISLPKASLVCFLNSEDKQIFTSENIVRENKVMVIKGEGIDCNYFKPKLDQQRKFKQIKFLFIGRLLFDKGIQEYYEAALELHGEFKQIEFGVLGFLGANNPKAISSEIFKKWTDSGVIKYYGSAKNVISYLEQTSCVVLPSYREGMSTVLMEAASMATPIITTNIPGCKELVDDGITGFLCEVKNHKDLVRKIKHFITLSEEQMFVMGEKARQKMEDEFSIDNVFKFYQSAINKYGMGKS